MMTSAEKLFELFKKLPDAYPDFVLYIPAVAEAEGVADELLDLLEGSEDYTTSDILEWIACKAGWEYH